jgi:hypothetical protein
MFETNGTLWYYDWDVPSGDDEEGTVTIRVYGKDNATNYLNPWSTNNTEKIIDNTAPTCTITYNNSDTYFKADAVIKIYANFTEEGSGIDPTSVIINISTAGDGGIENITMTESNNTRWYYDFTIPAGTDDDGGINVSIYASDNATYNLNPYPTTDETKYIDNTPPTLSYAVLDADYNGNLQTYVDIYFSENVANSTIATTDFDIDTAGVTVTAFYNDADTEHVTLKLSNKLTGDGPTVTIIGDGIQDIAGNAITTGTITINTYRITLEQGWNMFSIPADISDISIPVLLTSIWSNVNGSSNTMSILWYNATIPDWEYYSKHTQSGTLSEIEPGKAYWIKMNSSDTLIGNYSTVLHGTSPAPIIELTGHRWNMIGHWATYNQTANTTGGLSSLSDVLAETGEILYKYTSSGGFINVYGSSITNMEPGDGFWLYLKTSSTGYYTLAES